MDDQYLKQFLSPLLYERYSNLSEENKKIFIDALQKQLDTNNQIKPGTSNQVNGSQVGRVKVLSNQGNGSTTESEPVDFPDNNKFDNSAFIDVLILSSITAFFGLVSFLVILISCMN